MNNNKTHSVEKLTIINAKQSLIKLHILVVRIRILIGTTVVRIRILIDTTVERIASAQHFGTPPTGVCCPRMGSPH